MRSLILSCLLASSLLAGTVRAADFKIGPSCSLMEYKPNADHPVQLAPGLGVQGGLVLKNWTIDGAVYGSVLNLGPNTVGTLSTALFGCYTPLGICLGPAVDIRTSDGRGVLGNFLWKENFGIVFSLNWAALSKLHYTTEPDGSIEVKLQ
jgi:hypothetical protein